MRISDNSNIDNVGAASPTTRQSTMKNIFIDLIEKTVKHPEKHLYELSEFFNNFYHKKCLRSQIPPQKSGAFGALWDGALVLVNTIDLDAEQRIKDSDLQILLDSLNKLLMLF